MVWIHVEMDGLCWIDLFGQVSSTDEAWCVVSTFSGSLHSARSFCKYQWRLRMFLCKQRLLKTGFWRVAEFDVEMMKMVLPFVWQFGMSFIVFACACPTTNSKPFCLHFCCMWATGKHVCGECDVYFQQQLHGRFSLKFGWLHLWNFMLQHGACQQQNKRASDTAQWLEQSQGHFTCLFVCCEKKVRLSEVKSLNLSLVCLRVFASFISIAGAARTQA